MPKTTVYLSESEAEGLRRAAVRSKRSQSQLIREGVRLVAEREGADRRVFHSMGSGSGDGRPEVGWESDRLYRRKVLGERD
jgi:Arc/MetJ-type ribon-helix-helix transcriptional regulator